MALERRLKLVTDVPISEAEDVVKVAFASSDMKLVDQHFGTAEMFAIYALGPNRASFIEAVTFGRATKDGNEDKLAPRIDALKGCVAIYCRAVGGGAVKQLRARGIHTLKVTSNTQIKDLIDSLQGALRVGPSAWLARAMERNRPRDSRHFDAMEQEGWLE